MTAKCPALDSFFEESFVELMKAVPELPTQMGIFEVNGFSCPQSYFTAIDKGAALQRHQLLQQLHKRLHTLSQQETSEAQKLSIEVFDFFLRFVYEYGWTGIDGSDFLDYDRLIQPSTGLHSSLALFLMDLHPNRHIQDAEDFVTRLQQTPELIRCAASLIPARNQLGISLPAFLICDTLDEIHSFIEPKPAAHPICNAFARKYQDIDGISAASYQALLNNVEQLLGQELYPAYRELADILEKSIDSAWNDPGLWRLPDGDAYYEFLLHGATTTPMNADEIHELGRQESIKLTDEIACAFREIGYEEESIQACYQRMEREARGPLEDTAANRQQLFAKVEDMVTEIRHQVAALFHQLPAAGVSVKAIPAFVEAHRNHTYQPPAANGSREGIFEISLGQLLGKPAYDVPVLVYHETWPGHHLQFSHALEQKTLPTFRRMMSFDAYIEGWAKYAETIPIEHGIDSDPKVHLTRMRYELISTTNLILDTGIHTKRWSRDEAIQFFKDQTGLDHTFAQYIVHRSAAVPAQMCAYKIGLSKMKELKDRMQTTLNNEFDIRDFHDVVLRDGAIPLELLENQVNRELELR